MGFDSPNRHQQNCSQTSRQLLDRDPLFLDTETTGLENHAEICEIAVVDADLCRRIVHAMAGDERAIAASQSPFGIRSVPCPALVDPPQ